MKRRLGALAVLAACIAAALVFRRFVFLAWYPVAMSLLPASLFAWSLRGREPLCLAFAKKIPPHILPPGAEAYCRRYTRVWAVWLACNALIALATVFAPGPVWRLGGAGLELPWVWVLWNGCLSYCVTFAIILVEMAVRRRRFAAVFTTSGSTGKPKRIVRPFPLLAREVAYHRDHLRALAAGGERPLFLATVEPRHLYGMLWHVLLPAAAGCPADPEVILSPEALLAKMRGAARVFLVTTPSFLDRFCAYADQYDVPQNAVEIVTSGALLEARTSAAAARVFGRVPLEIFGSTETGGVAWRRQDGSAPDACDWRVFDPVRVATDAEGRLVVRSPFSYARRYTLGDGAALASDARRFALLGRRDRLVKINEQRVSLPELEAKLAALPDVREAALVVLDGPHGPRLGAVIAGPPRPPLALRREILPLFPRGTAPRHFRFVRALPRNAQGKIPVAHLKELFDGHA